MTDHVPVPCSVPRCQNEASFWVADIAGRETFYLCDTHNVETEGFYQHIETDGSVTNREVAVYACADPCEVCN